MDCKTFKEKYDEYSYLPLPREVFDTPEWQAWKQHSFNCKECSDWSMAQELKKRNQELSDFLCVHIAYYTTKTCIEHPNYYDCSDIIIHYNKHFDEYSIAPRGGRGDNIMISHCPWCGIELPASKRDLFFDTLDALGINYPEEDAPESLLKPKWWLSL